MARRDCFTQSIATLACALHWFNLLVWLAAGRMRRERELACDDFVLSDGTRPSTYAGHLLEIANCNSPSRADPQVCRAHRDEATGARKTVCCSYCPRRSASARADASPYWRRGHRGRLRAVGPAGRESGRDRRRFLITAAVAAAEPANRFVVLTQNALADGAYLEYLRALHARDLSVPTDQDLQRSFDEYMVDVASRYHAGKLLPGEHMKDKGDGRLEVSGQGAVMQINALLAKRIFEANPDRQFFIEESWPLEWMYPHLSPHGLILKVNREPLEQLPPEVVAADGAWWAPRVKQMIGGWLKEETAVSEVADFVDRVYHRHDLYGFDGDRDYVTLSDQHDLYGKPRTAIASLYQWRMEHAKTAAEKDRMAAAADFAFRQAFALAPASAESVARYVKFLHGLDRESDAQRVVRSARLLASEEGNPGGMVRQLEMVAQ
ncbi:MAG: hypothetical protein H7A46_10380 [Verrucomicrobiales bacterium]|nr:hypothetical protein [Verrucomicrobiales bacterium]